MQAVILAAGMGKRLDELTKGNTKYTFEVGGKKKGKKQIEDIPNSYIVKDDIENAGMRYIPLWMFGLLY